MSLLTDVFQSAKAVILGMKTTISQLPKESWTVQYPDEPITVQPRYRGMHLLHVDENGKEKCVACYLCAAACPSDCIYIEARLSESCKRSSSSSKRGGAPPTVVL